MKKEEVYINLQGKTKEELTDLWEFLTSNGEKPYRDLESFLEYSKENFEPIGFSFREFCGLGRDGHKNKTEVTIQQLKEIIRPMDNKEFEKGDKVVITDFGRITSNKQTYNFTLNKPYILAKDFNKKNGFFVKNDDNNNKNNGWSNAFDLGIKIDIFKENLIEQLQKAEAEVNRLQYLIEEENNIKIGDWVKRTYNGIELFKADDTHDYRYINSEKRVYQKITNPELIKLIEDETNENNLFR